MNRNPPGHSAGKLLALVSGSALTRASNKSNITNYILYRISNDVIKRLIRLKLINIIIRLFSLSFLLSLIIFIL